MRVELIYAPGCGTYRQALNTLETVIAEERLPLPVELVSKTSGEPQLRIDGEDCGVPRVLQCIETLRETLGAKWTDITVSPLVGV
jgi:hypothetical protein